jgi:hypothetical protein
MSLAAQTNLTEEEENPKVFRKCEQCNTRPASILCKQCGSEEKAAMFCYTCSRTTHEDLEHNYEYACYNGSLLINPDMLVVDLGSDLKPEQEPLSQQDSHLREFCLRDGHSFGTHESRLSNKTPEKAAQDDREPTQHTNPTISKSKSKLHLHANTPAILTASFKQKAEDKENLNPQNHFLTIYNDDTSHDKSKDGDQKIGKRDTKYKIDEDLFILDDKTLRSNALTEKSFAKQSPQKSVSTQRYQDILESDTNLATHESPATRTKPDSRGAQPRNEKPPENSGRTIAGATDTPALAPDTSSGRPHRKRESSDDTRRIEPAETKAQPHEHFLQSRSPGSPEYGYNKSSTDSTGGILLASDTKHRSEDERGQVIYSQMYIESMQELHKTELDNLVTKHHYEKEQIRKDFEHRLKKKSEEATQNSGNATLVKQLKHTVLEYEQIVANLKHQNALLREENSLFRKSEYDREREFEEYKRDIEGRVSHMKNALYAEILKYAQLTEE